MEINNNTRELLANINAENNNELTFNEEAIQAELNADAAIYTGIGIKALSIIGGLLGSLFFLGFVFMAVKDAEGAMMIFGLITIAAAVWVEKIQTSTVLDAACVGGYLAGFAMLGIGANKLFDSDNTTTFILLIAALAAMAFKPGYMVSLFSVLMINGCLFAFVNINDTYQLIHLLTLLFGGAYIYLNFYESNVLAAGVAINKLYKPVIDGVLVSLITILLYLSARRIWDSKLNNEWVSSIIIIALLVFAITRITASVKTERSALITIYVLSGIILLPLIFAPAICGVILILLVSYHMAHYRGMVAAIIALIYFVGQYYYDLNFTLLAKSGMMFGTGVLFLAVWFILKKQLQHYEKS